MSIKANRPIGIFDSGIGGLTVAHAVKNLLPQEQLIYFGDTAHLPYGDKSTAAIQAYSVKITDMLMQMDSKVVLIACNSASSAAYELVREFAGKKAHVFNVIDPVIDYLRENHTGKKVGLIGTKQTVNSRMYEQKIQAEDPSINMVAMATPLLAPMIEEGFYTKAISGQIIAEYLSDPIFEGIEAMVLGCTHYPLIKEQVNDFFGGQVDILDSAEIVARSLKAFLELHNLNTKAITPSYQFMVSDYTSAFEQSAKTFFKEDISLETRDLWN